MALLVSLARKPGSLWARADLIDEIWPNGAGGDESLSRLVSLLRKALVSDHGLTDIVKTIPKLGYRLDADIKLASGDSAALSEAAPEHDMQAVAKSRANLPAWLYAVIVLVVITSIAAVAFFLMSGPSTLSRESSFVPNDSTSSLAVLPIETLAGDGRRPFLAEGMTRDLTAALSRVPNARVSPFSSIRELGGTRIDTAQAARQLDVRYIVSGSMVEEGDRLVLRIDLSDAQAGQQIWSKRFTEPLDNFFELQDQVIQAISTSIFSEIKASQIAQLRNERDFNLSVYELVQKAESERSRYGREPAKKIMSYLERAVEIDPENYSARAALATQLAQNVISGFSDNPKKDAPLALQYLDEIRSVAPRDPNVLTSTALIQYYIKGDMPAAQRLLEQSLSIDPNEPHAAVVLGLTKCYTGKIKDGLTLIRNSEARAPRDPRTGVWAWFRSACLSVEGEIVQAERAAEEAIDRNPNYPPFHYALASYKCLLGKEGDARNAVQQSRRLDIEFGQKDYERLLSTASFPGTPDKSRDEVFKIMRTCLAIDKS